MQTRSFLFTSDFVCPVIGQIRILFRYMPFTVKVQVDADEKCKCVPMNLSNVAHWSVTFACMSQS